jgi:hypothetical protein
MLCNENCRMGDPANRLILSIVVSGVPRNQKGMLPGRRFTHTRAAGAQRPPDRGRMQHLRAIAVAVPVKIVGIVVDVVLVGGLLKHALERTVIAAAAGRADGADSGVLR